MRFGDAILYAFTTLGSVAVGGGIVIGLGSWLGKIWAERIARSELHEQQLAMQDLAARSERALAEFRERSEVGLRRLEAEVERQRFVHSLQFKQEFDAYRHIWRAISEVRRRAVALRPTVGLFDRDEPPEKRKARLLKEFWSAYNAFAEAVEPEKPFYPQAMYEELLILSQLLKREAVEYEHGEPGDKGYWAQAKENNDRIEQSVERVCVVMRQRLGLTDEEGERSEAESQTLDGTGEEATSRKA